MSAHTAKADDKEAKAVRQMIVKVNDKWQKDHSAEVRAFWDEAAYHTGNMEAFRLTGEQRYLRYSEQWAHKGKRQREMAIQAVWRG